MLSPKQKLNQLLQREGKETPKYDVQYKGPVNSPNPMEGICTLPTGERFTSAERHSKKKQAEQDAAQRAYDYLIKNTTTVTPNYQIDNNFKGLLQEVCQKKNLALPRYTIKKVAGSRPTLQQFECKVDVLDQNFETDQIYKTIKAAQQAVAEKAYLELAKQGYIESTTVSCLSQSSGKTQAKDMSNPKVKLTALLSKHGESQPAYSVIDEIGPAHDKKWTVKLSLQFQENEIIKISTKDRKKAAEEDCAFQAVDDIYKRLQISSRPQTKNLDPNPSSFQKPTKSATLSPDPLPNTGVQPSSHPLPPQNTTIVSSPIPVKHHVPSNSKGIYFYQRDKTTPRNSTDIQGGTPSSPDDTDDDDTDDDDDDDDDEEDVVKSIGTISTGNIGSTDNNGNTRSDENNIISSHINSINTITSNVSGVLSTSVFTSIPGAGRGVVTVAPGRTLSVPGIPGATVGVVGVGAPSVNNGKLVHPSVTPEVKPESWFPNIGTVVKSMSPTEEKNTSVERNTNQPRLVEDIYKFGIDNVDDDTESEENFVPGVFNISYHNSSSSSPHIPLDFGKPRDGKLFFS